MAGILERQSPDPLLPALTAMLAVLLFVFNPLQANGVVSALFWPRPIRHGF